MQTPQKIVLYIGTTLKGELDQVEKSGITNKLIGHTEWLNN